MGMTIPLKEAEVVNLPPTDAVVADKVWISSITINTPSPQREGSILLSYFPWVGDRSKEPVRALPNGTSTERFVQINQMYRALSECPELKFVFDTILANVVAIRDYAESVHVLEPHEISTDDSAVPEHIGTV